MRFTTIAALGLAGTAFALPNPHKPREHLPNHSISGAEVTGTPTPSHKLNPVGSKTTAVGASGNEGTYFKLLAELESNISRDNSAAATDQAAGQARIDKLRDDFLAFQSAENAWWSASVAYETPASGEHQSLGAIHHGEPKETGSAVAGEKPTGTHHGHHSGFGGPEKTPSAGHGEHKPSGDVHHGGHSEPEKTPSPFADEKPSGIHIGSPVKETAAATIKGGHETPPAGEHKPSGGPHHGKPKESSGAKVTDNVSIKPLETPSATIKGGPETPIA
ncbi:hypothetical protein N7495_009747 [Penicillium taxi]|uniref:uncharacterized protein n=1 Tax=Penicillium taxi TaxID=168475 RepID=UPI0025454A9E|nr:uncharacterized protein N7495_009747 [Penicillium taxi]KAJ5885237.1 hypothetical protein N7495_009747 [Penicillium taxi]